MEATNLPEFMVALVFVMGGYYIIRAINRWTTKRMELLDAIVERQKMENNVYRSLHIDSDG